MNVNNRADINSVLSQMRSMKTQMHQASQANPAAQAMQSVGDVKANVKPDSLVQGIEGVSGVEKSQAPSFSEMFKSAIDTVNDHQSRSTELSSRYASGDTSIDLPEVMIAAQKSSVSFQALTQVRNKVVEAYKEIMNMPI